MPDQSDLEIVRAHIDGWNAHDLGRILAGVDDSFTLESDSAPMPVRGPDDLRRFARMYLDAFPDLRFDIDEAVAARDLVLITWVARGTQTGPLGAVPASGRRAEVRGCSVNYLRHGRIVRVRTYWDNATLLRQIGALPARADAALPAGRERPSATEVRP
jgi:steroid delta-isomerase-like uncharacterized protein